MQRKGYLIVLRCLLIALFCSGAVADVRKHSFSIIQLNDVYEIFPAPTRLEDRYELRGGLAYAATLIRQTKKHEPVLILHAGDFLSPSLLSIKFKHKGAQMITAMNAMHVDLATFGNHEFDFGCHVLADRIRQSKFGWVSANVTLPSEMNIPRDKVFPYKIVKIAGLRVGIFGLTLEMERFPCEKGFITFQDPYQQAQELIQRLEKEKVDLIIALTHLSMEQDRKLASLFPEIDFIVGGHDHEPMADLLGKTLITKAGANATSLGIIKVTTVRNNPELIVEKKWIRKVVNPQNLKQDPEVAAALVRYTSEMEALSKKIGTTEVPLDIREEVVREGESNFGNYVTDLMRAEMQADVALLNGGAFRGDRIIPAGPLSLEDLDTVLLFDNQMVAISITGGQLLKALENGVSKSGQQSGRFPQVSGISFTFEARKPPGQRVVQAIVGNVELKKDQIYTMATTDFLVSSGNMDGYDLPREIIRTGGDLNELVIRSLANAPIRATQEGRIVRLGRPKR